MSYNLYIVSNVNLFQMNLLLAILLGGRIPDLRLSVLSVVATAPVLMATDCGPGGEASPIGVIWSFIFGVTL